MKIAVSIQRDMKRASGTMRPKPLKWQMTGMPHHAAAVTTGRLGTTPLEQ